MSAKTKKKSRLTGALVLEHGAQVLLLSSLLSVLMMMMMIVITITNYAIIIAMADLIYTLAVM